MSNDSSADPTLVIRPSGHHLELARIVRSAGLMERRTGSYAVRIGLVLSAVAGGWAMFVWLGDTWWQLVTAALLAVVWTHVAFIGHDAGHRQILRGRRANDMIGLLHASLIGMSYGAWVGKHDRHHAHPNHEHYDPDLDLPLLAFTVGQSRTKQGLQRWTARYQAYLFGPLLLLEGLNLHWSSAVAVKRGSLPYRWSEATLLIGHTVVYVTGVLLVLPAGKAIAFMAVHQGLWGFYMGCCFAPNHKGMPTAADQDWDFLRRQVLTSRNVRGGRWIDVALGGLNYQIEHHLFPAMPRPNLRRAQPLVQPFCAAHGVRYQQVGLFRSYRDVLSGLHAAGAPLRGPR